MQRCQELRAYNEMLLRVERENAAEIERLKADYAALLPDFHAAEEDIERLQAALHEHDPQSCDYCSGHPLRELPPDEP